MEAPLILCGPMVRRVEPSSISVFLVLRENLNITIQVFSGSEIVASSTRKTIRLGNGLYAATVTAKPETPLQWGEVYHYDLFFEDPSGTKPRRNLYDDDVLVVGSASSKSAMERLVYGNETRPSFMLPHATPTGLRILHGSCRKPHGKGEDALAEADRRMESAGAHSPERPQQLFLTGDQIYADDVHPKLLEQLIAHSQASLGEAGPEPPRKDLLQGAHLTTNEGDYHLFSLGEFFAMYLFAWSTIPWKAPPAAEALRPFYDDIQRVRRLFANVATYMIFDDHEVTDDWFLDRGWTNAVLNSNPGRRLIRHALLAYSVFQHWGNEPSQFEEGAPGATLLSLLDTGMWDSRVVTVDDALGLPYDASELAQERPSSLVFSYRFVGACYEVIVLDTRMRRAFNEAGRMTLMSAENIRKTFATTKPPPFTIVVSAAPLLGQKLIDWGQGVLAKIGFAKRLDYEGWVQAHTLDDLITQLMERSPVVVLSGDIHFSLGVVLRDKAAPQRRIVNFTSSALKNEPSAFIARILTDKDGSKLEAAAPIALESTQIVLNDTLTDAESTVALKDLVVPRVTPVALQDREYEESLLISTSVPKEQIFLAIPPQEQAGEGEARLEAAVSHSDTAVMAWANYGEIRVETDKIVQVLVYSYRGAFHTRRDTAKFVLRQP